MSIDRRSDLGANFVRSIFDYDETSGRLFWRDGDHFRPNDRGRLVGKPAGSRKPTGYVIIIKLRGKPYPAHRLVWLHRFGEWPDTDIDHIDGDKANNRISNLRLATRSENMRNVGAYACNKAGMRGVSYEAASGKWRAQITLHRRTKTLGRFGSPDEAYAAYRAAASELHGQFARAA